MRRMISDSKIAVKNGRVGTYITGSEERIISFGCDCANEVAPFFENLLIATDVSAVDNLSTGTVVEVENPQPQYGDNVAFAYDNGTVVFWVIKGRCYRIVNSGTKIKVYGKLVDQGHQQNYFNIERGTVSIKVFKAFKLED